MGKIKKRERSPSVEKLQKKFKALQEIISAKLREKTSEEVKENVEPREETLMESSSRDEIFDIGCADGSDEASDNQSGSDGDSVEDEGSESNPKFIEETDSVEVHDFAELDQETLAILGEDSGSKSEEKFVFHPNLANTWDKVLAEGLKKDKKSELLEKYPRKGNCSIDAPKLNPEIEASLNDTIRKRDKFFTLDQELCAGSLSALGSAITRVFESQKKPVDTKDLLVELVDAGKLLCELHNQLTKARKAFIYPGLDKKARTVLENSKTGEYLFGPELTQRIKTAKSVEKLGLSLKPQITEKKSAFRATGALNWRGPPGAVRQQTQVGYRGRGYSRVLTQRPFLQRRGRSSSNQGQAQAPVSQPGPSQAQK